MASSAPSVSPRGIVVTVWLVLAACRGDGRTPVVLYSPHGRDQLTLLEQAFEAERPDIDVRWLDMGSQEILDRLRFERVNPQADVWFGGPTTTFDLGIEDSLLEPYRPSWADRAGPNGIGPRDLYYPVYRTPAVIAYNNRAVRPQEAPGDWDEVLQPRWCGKVIIRDPMASGTMRAIWGLILITSIRETGDTARGMDWLRRLDACTKTYTLNPAILDAKLARAEGLVTQLLAATRVFRLPARHDLPADRVPAWVAEVEAEMVAAPMDWGMLAAHGAEWMGYWDRHVRGSGRGGR